MRAVVVEDIGDVRKGLIALIETHLPDIEVVGEAGSVVEAAKVIKASNPELLFLDIELPDGTGFDILDIAGEGMHVIFTTASDAYAVRAFSYAAIDYLLKPIVPEDLVKAVDRAGKMGPVSAHQFEILRGASAGEGQPGRIALHTSDRIHIVNVADIVACQADGNYTRFSIKEHPPLLVAKTLKQFDQLLAGGSFARVHQSYLVNLQAVKEYVKVDGGYLVLKDGQKIPVSTRKKSELLNRLGDIPHA